MKVRYETLWSGLILLIGLFSCTTNPITGGDIAENPDDVVADMNVAPDDIVGSWQGFAPCAGCPGITYNLVFTGDYTYQEALVYEDRDPVIHTGTWRITDGVVELGGGETETKRFTLSTAGELRMLDMAGKPINTELEAQYNLKRNLDASEDSFKLWDDKRKVGVDFVATGHDPGWVLEIDMEGDIFFKTRPLGDVEMKVPVPAPGREGEKIRYQTTTGSGELIVELMKQTCTDAMSGMVRPFTVRVKANAKEYNGCGMYLGESRSR